MYPASQIWWSSVLWKRRNVVFYIYSSMNTFKKLKSPPQSSILRNVQNQKYRFKIPKSRTRLAEKRKEGKEEEHKQLQSVMRFTQTQKLNCKALCVSSKRNNLDFNILFRQTLPLQVLYFFNYFYMLM